MNIQMTRRGFGLAALATAISASLNETAQGAAPAKGRSYLESWRAMFPALDQQVNGKPLVYLDSAATTQRALPVLDEIMDFYRRDNANPGAALHELARRAHERYENARRTLATFINAASPAVIVWTRGTTEGINLVSTAWGRSRLQRGDEVLLTIAEHASNLLPWRLAAEATGAIVRFVDVDDEGRVSIEDLDRKLSNRTRLVAFSHVSNVAGYICVASVNCLCPLSSSPRSQVRERRSCEGSLRTCLLNAATTISVLLLGTFISITKRDLRSTNVPDGLWKNRTGAIYKIPAGDRIWHQNRNEDAWQQYDAGGPQLIERLWFEYEIDVRGNVFKVKLTNTDTGQSKQTTRYENTDAARGQGPGHIGIQAYPGSVIAYRAIQIHD